MALGHSLLNQAKNFSVLSLQSHSIFYQSHSIFYLRKQPIVVKEFLAVYD